MRPRRSRGEGDRPVIAPDALRPWATAAATNRALRAMHREAPREAAPGGNVFLVLLGGAIPPETVPAGAWRTVEGRPVAVVAHLLARNIAVGRAPGAAEVLEQAPPAGGAWCIALAPDGSAVTWSTPIESRGGARGGARHTTRGGDA
mgnify:CR=1 FL=1